MPDLFFQDQIHWRNGRAIVLDADENEVPISDIVTRLANGEFFGQVRVSLNIHAESVRAVIGFLAYRETHPEMTPEQILRKADPDQSDFAAQVRDRVGRGQPHITAPEMLIIHLSDMLGEVARRMVGGCHAKARESLIGLAAICEMGDKFFHEAKK